MKIVDTYNWAIKPERGYAFRVQDRYFECLFSIGRFAVIREITL